MLLAAAAGASGSSVLAPEWSRPLPAPPLTASVRRGRGGADELFLLLANRAVLAVSGNDSMVQLGTAPEGTTALAAVPDTDSAAPALRPAVEAPGPDYEPADPDERLWLRITDLVSVLKETRARLRTRLGV
jgi:hypothetical protein